MSELNVEPISISLKEMLLYVLFNTENQAKFVRLVFYEPANDTYPKKFRIIEIPIKFVIKFFYENRWT